MISVINRVVARFANNIRRQNFFELNPVFPDNAQKDFDIYNVDYNQQYPSILATKE